VTSLLARRRATVTRVERVDEVDVVEFQERHFGPGSRQTRRDVGRWLFEENPWRAGDGPELWVSRPEGVVVGQQGGIPYRLKVGPMHEDASWAIDLMVDPRWRLRGVGPVLSETHATAHPVATAVGLSTAAHRAYLRAGWTDLGTLPLWVRPIDVARSLALRTRDVPFARFLRLPATIALGGEALALGGLARASGTDLEDVDRFDDRSDAVWARSARHLAVAATRNLAWAAWRFDDVPGRDQLERAYVTNRGAAVGYVVLRTDLSTGAALLSVVDYLVPPGLVLPLIGLVVRRATERGVVAVVWRTLHERVDVALRAAAFVRADSESDPGARFMVRVADEHPASGLIRRRDRWFLTAADSDLDADLVYDAPRSAEPS
jgi:GNAT superfamily N-acetyltransferase